MNTSSAQISPNTQRTGVALGDRPPWLLCSWIGLQHFLAVFGGIVTAPLLIALGMGLNTPDTTYLISSSLLISGVATAIQIWRFGPVGSGLLSIQGTSFSFVGPLIYLYHNAQGSAPDVILGRIFVACMIGALIMMVLSRFIDRLRRIITQNVAGVTVLLLGLTLIWATIGTLIRSYQNAISNQLPGWHVVLMATAVFTTIVVVSRLPGRWLRPSCIVIGLGVGFALAAVFGALQPVAPPANASNWFVPELARFPLSVDMTMVLVLLPIFIVSATESVGDLTATADLSGLPIGDKPFWQRIKGGILADAINSCIAAAFSTFPNTTFSQNNGVIRMTGVSSRRVGLVVAALLVLAGSVPSVARLVQVLPDSVIAGATLLMFIMVTVSGWHIVQGAKPATRDWLIVAIAIAGGLSLAQIAPMLDMLPTPVTSVIGFPVSSGAFIAMLLELVIPKHALNGD
ncbi:MAG: solute carrier family 23 protein [Pseudomonadota bacterium]